MFTRASPYTPVNMIPDVYVNNLGAFGEYELPVIEALVFTAGIRGDVIWIDADKENNATEQGDSTDFTEVSGNLQLVWKPAEGLQIFTGLARSVRPPAPDELYIDVPAMAPAVTWRGNPHLKPTVNHQADLGVKYSTDRFYANASVFYSDLTDFINLYQASSTLKTYQNIDAKMWGAGFSSQVALPYNLFLKGAVSYVWGKNEDADHPLPEIPPFQGTVGVRYDNNTYFLEIAENFAARQDRVDRSLGETTTSDWSTTDIKAGFRYRGFSLYAGIYNLFDKFYYTYLSYVRDPFATGEKLPEPGRNFALTATYSF
jgi:iron complex outermembrane receptor protein